MGAILDDVKDVHAQQCQNPPYLQCTSSCSALHRFILKSFETIVTQQKLPRGLCLCGDMSLLVHPKVNGRSYGETLPG